MKFLVVLCLLWAVNTMICLPQGPECPSLREQRLLNLTENGACSMGWRLEVSTEHQFYKIHLKSRSRRETAF